MMQTEDKHSAGVGVDVGAEIRGSYRWCADSPSRPNLSHPLITLAFKSVMQAAKAFISVIALAKDHHRAESQQPKMHSC